MASDTCSSGLPLSRLQPAGPAVLEIPHPPDQDVPAPLHLLPEATHSFNPQSKVQLAMLLVPLPFVVGETGPVDGLQDFKDPGFRPPQWVVPPRRREFFGIHLHADRLLFTA